MSVDPIRETARYDGLRVQLKARLGTASCVIQWDIGFGDAITPGPEEVRFETMLEDVPSPVLRIYPRETAFAEKLEAIVVLGMTNSRMKDYFDLLSLIREARMDPTSLAHAITATFERRATPLPAELPIGLTAAFALDKTKHLQWRAFLDRSRLEAPALEGTVAEIAAVVSRVLEEARR
jgi:hypothetical protein